MKFGKAFSDNVTEEHKRLRLFDVPESSWWVGFGRTLFFLTLCIGVFFILIWRLFYLTVISGHSMRILADNNRVRELIRHAPRGELLDRAGNVLVGNTPHFRLLKPCDDNAEKQCVSHITKEEGETLQAKGLPSGWFLEIDWSRQYSIPEAIAHVVGYIGEVNQEELSDEYYKLRQYRSGDIVGRSGAEATFEERLRGKDGKELVEVDAQGKILRTLGRESEIPGENLTLSLDKELSRVVAESFPKDMNGAIVVSKPDTGEILALYSSPTYSPVPFVEGLTQASYEKLFTDSNRPMFNRAIGGVYPPGSIFKLVTSVAGLEEGAIKKDTIVEDTGEIRIGSYVFPNWYFLQYGKTDGPVDVAKALQRSNDIYFYKVGEWLGISKLSAWAKKMGVGKPVGIELSGEASGLMPDPQWKNSMFHTDTDIASRNNEWYLGDTYHVSIGQGYLLTTPLQGNTWTNVVANGGKLCRPTILKQLSGKQPNCKQLDIKKETIDVVTLGMKKACETGGTGYPFFDFGIRKIKNADGVYIATTSGTLTKVPVACKTGTAEFGGVNDKTTHAWFTAFAPLRLAESDSVGQTLSSDTRTIIGEPEISVTVLIEGAGQGSDKAAPVAKKIMEAWFLR